MAKARAKARTKLDSLVSRATAAASDGPARQPKRPRHETGVRLEASDLAVVREMVAAGELARHVNTRHERLKQWAKQRLFLAFTVEFWKRKTKPTSPRIVLRDERGEPEHDTLYQLQDAYSLAAFEGVRAILEALTAEPAEGAGPGAAIDAPLARAHASKLIADELTTSPTLRLRYSLTELAEGHMEDDATGTSVFVPATKEEKAIASKLLAYLLAERGPRPSVSVLALTDAERSHILQKDPRLAFRDPKGFADRICGYCSSLAQLRRVLNVFRPVQKFGSSHFAIPDDDVKRSHRLIEVLRQILGITEST